MVVREEKEEVWQGKKGGAGDGLAACVSTLRTF